MMFGDIRDTRYKQYFAAIAATSICISTGLAFTWPSPSLPKLQSPESPIGRPITDEEGSWLVSAILLSSIPGSILGGYTVDKFGRKRNILITSLSIFIHSLMMSFGKSFEILFAARFIGGLSMSLAGLASTIYTAEIAEVEIRGKLGTYLMFLKTSGSLIGLVVGPYISYESLGLLSACFPIITIIIVFFMPESPFYYVKINQIGEARNCLKKLSGRNITNEDINKRLILIQETIEKDMRNKTSLREFLQNDKYRYTIFLMMGIKTLQQLSGASALEAYLQPIIALSESGIKPELASIVIGCIQLPAVFLSSVLVDKLGRRPLLITSALGCCLALIGEGTYFLIENYLHHDTSSISWLPTVGLALFWFMNPMGILTLPYVLMGELFPTNIKGIAVASSAVYGAVMGFIVSKFFKPMSNAIGMHFVFYIFATICLLGACFVFFLLPETKGKNFTEIEALVCKNNPKNRRQGDSGDIEDYGTIQKL